MTNRDQHPPLVYDISKSGHRARGAQAIAALLGGTVLLQTPLRAVGRLLGHRGCLVWQTADYALGAFSIVALLRGLLGRKTVGICYRNNSNNSDRKYIKHAIRKFLFRTWNGLPFCRALTTRATPAEAAAPSFLYDIEWWDLAVLPLTVVAVADVRAGRKTVMLLGSISYLKGVDFFIDTALAALARGIAWNFVLIGSTAGLNVGQKDRLALAGVTVLPGPDSDDVFLSYMQQADFLWCCYHPVYDQSSGIFGRALQLGKATIVRKDSHLDAWQRIYGQGFAIEFGDVDGLLEGLETPLSVTDRSDTTRLIFEAARERLWRACT